MLFEERLGSRSVAVAVVKDFNDYAKAHRMIID